MISRLDVGEWKILCEEVEALIVSGKHTPDNELEAELKRRHPDFVAFLITSAVKAGREFLRTLETVKSHLNLELYGLELNELIEEMAQKEPRINKGIVAAAVKKVFPEFRELAFAQSENLAKSAITDREINQPPWILAKEIAQRQFPERLAECAFGMLVKACQMRIDKLKELELQRKRVEEERKRKLQLEKEKEEREREEKRQEKIRAKLERKKAILLRLRIPILLANGFSLSAISIKEKDEIGLLDDGTIVVFDGQVYKTEKKSGGQVRYTLELGAEIIEEKRETKRKPETLLPLPRFNEAWVVSSRGTTGKALQVPREFLDRRDFFSNLKAGTWIMSESLTEASRFRLYEFSGRELVGLGFCRQATLEEKRSAKTRPCLMA